MKSKQEIRDEAKKWYLINKDLYDKFSGKANSKSVILMKYVCIMSAGIYNVDKKMYEKGYRLATKQLYLLVDSEYDNTFVVKWEEDYSVSAVEKNDNAYLTMCNHLKTSKENIDCRHKCLMAWGYFD